MNREYAEIPPLYSEIMPGLWQGGTDDEDTVDRPGRLPVISQRKEFDAVVTLDAYAKPMGWYVKEYRFCFPDAQLDSEHLDEIERIADWAFIEWKAGLNTLIRCQAGLNRSSLITGLVLLRDRMKADEVIKTIRKNRGVFALSNESYFNYLRHWKRK